MTTASLSQKNLHRIRSFEDLSGTRLSLPIASGCNNRWWVITGYPERSEGSCPEQPSRFARSDTELTNGVGWGAN